MKLLNTIASAVALMVATMTCSFAATEIDEKDFGPTYGSMVADTIVGKPLGALAVVGGVVTAIASMPFTIYNDEIDQVERKLILEPLAALDRCLGCTPAEDQYFRSQRPNNDQVRVTVDGPSEILINTNQKVVVKTP